jgi:hypothetical protein
MDRACWQMKERMMIVEGGCYCGGVRYRAEGEPLLKAECFCRECQYVTGGNSVLIMAMPVEGFKITKGATKAFARPDLEKPVSREFCPECGTHMITRAPSFPAGVILKVGSMDDPSQYGGPVSAHYACDAYDHHRLPDHIPVFQKWVK